MKKTYLIGSSLLLMIFVGFIGCKKKYEVKTALFDETSSMAQLRVIHAAPNFRRVFNRQDSFAIYINNQKITNTFLTYAGAFPGITTNPYVALNAGSKDIRFVLLGRVLIDSFTVTALGKNMEAGKSYSLVITDSLANNKDNQVMWLTDNYKRPATGSYALRFVHAVLNQPVGVDVFSTRTGANVFTNVNRASASPFIELPSNSFTNDTLIVRATGTTTEIARFNGFPRTDQRIFTAIFRGDATVATGTKARALIYTVNE